MLGLNFLLRSVQSWFPSCSLMIFSLLCTHSNCPLLQKYFNGIDLISNKSNSWVNLWVSGIWLFAAGVGSWTYWAPQDGSCAGMHTKAHWGSAARHMFKAPPLPYFWIHLPYNCDLSKEEWWVCHPITESIMGNQHPKSTKQESITTHEF